MQALRRHCTTNRNLHVEQLQQAGETPIASGADAIGEIGKDVTQKIYNFTINTNDPNSAASKVLGAIKAFG